MLTSAGDYVAMTLSPQQQLAYCVTESGFVECFNVSTGELKGKESLKNAGEIIGIAGHPLANIIAVSDDKGRVHLLKA